MAHDHDHPHEPGAESYGRAFAIGISVNVAFVVVEAAFGIAAGSVALVADAAHNLSDVLGLALAWAALALARRKPTAQRTYGLRKTTVLAALGNAVLLVVAVGGVAWEAIGRLRHPAPVEGGALMAVAAVGVVINGVSAMLFAKGRKSDANVRGAFLHLAADAAVSLGVVVTGAIMLRTRWTWLDPLVSLLVSGVILVGTWGLFKKSLNLALDAVPDGIDAEKVQLYLASLPGVLEVHDLHIWAMSTTETALTAHLVMATNTCEPRFLGDVGAALRNRFEIDHSTLQVEPREAPNPCRQGAPGAL
ncbi:MAG: cation transporter [Myxococcales bacterium]|jgi:cobalt-zinc-cadmium efflux system protein|nr:cation transporter [Myxococcales bacterium]MBL0195852.1 cation transporter [Myxococcales bacterium]HQY61976.1 cation diffusion facilitator family transporter [Polyangiaceae bacterium]